MAGVRIQGKRLMPFVRVALEFPDQRETAPLFGCNGAHAEYLIRAHGDAVFLALAAVAIDHRPEDSGFLRALCCRVAHWLVMSESSGHLRSCPNSRRPGVPRESSAECPQGKGGKKSGELALPARCRAVTF